MGALKSFWLCSPPASVSNRCLRLRSPLRRRAITYAPSTEIAAPFTDRFPSTLWQRSPGDDHERQSIRRRVGFEMFIPLSECVTNSPFFRHICQSVEVYFQRPGCRCRYAGRRSLPVSTTWWTWSVRETRNVFEGATLIWQLERGHPGEPPEWPLLNDLSLARSVNRLTWIYFHRPGVNPPL